MKKSETKSSETKTNDLESVFKSRERENTMEEPSKEQLAEWAAIDAQMEAHWDAEADREYDLEKAVLDAKDFVELDIVGAEERWEHPDVKIDFDDLVLKIYHGEVWYEVYLPECSTPADIVHWMSHLQEKSWMTNELTGQFFTALEHACHEIFHAPLQSLFFSGSRPRELNWRKAAGMKSSPRGSDLVEVLARNTNLSAWGLGGPQSWVAKRNRRTVEHFEGDREYLKKEVRGFQLCCQWLALYRRRKTINLSLGTSYGLKHAVEQWSGEYVTNGAFIAAVIHMGIPYRSRADNPNIKIAISRKLVDGARTSRPDESKLVSGPIYPSASAGTRNGLLS
jgi:hypothetical protein